MKKVKDDRDRNANLRTQFNRILRRAGVTPWPRLFQNLRASRETELTNQFPIHVVTEWLGNTPSIASKHYLQVTDDHFLLAVESGGGATGGAQEPEVVQQSVPSASDSNCQQLPESKKVSGVTTFSTASPETSDYSEAPPVGLEPTTRRLTAACSTN